MAKYNLPDEAYTPAGINVQNVVTPSEARKEYQRLRKIAMQRLDALENSEFSDSEILAYRRKRPFTPSSALANEELGRALSEVRHFLEQQTSSVAGQRKMKNKAIDKLHSHGYTFVNSSNFRDFGKFMEAARAKAGGRLYASDRVAELYAAAERKKIPPEKLLEDFEYWRANVEELNDTPRIKGKGATSDDYRAEIERRKKQLGTVAQRRRK